MNKPKQATLFQSWGNRSKQDGNVQSRASSSHQRETMGRHGNAIDLCDDNDDEDLQLARALEESLANYQNTSNDGSHQHTSDFATSRPSTSHRPSHTDAKPNDGNVSFGIDDTLGVVDSENHCLSQTKPSDFSADDLPGFDSSAGRLWIYPTNYPVREYQFNIVKQALVKNTLVTLPTGLGKTFIASVLMYNFYRWYPEGKVVFMAPTKPLVAQQIEACYDIMGIPRDDTAEMTGAMNPTDRQKAWRDRRVFFLTPQVLTNDLSRGTCAAEAVKCLVVDEAHKALGNHAYCQVVRELVKYTRQFRVLALSATPGSDIKAVQQVISNLLVSHIELRSEESADIKPYTHERTVDKMVIPLGDELNSLKTKYIQVLSVVVNRLIHQRVLYNREPTSLSKFLILKAREAFRQNPPESLPRAQYGVVEGDFALAMSLYHGFELLQLHGLRSLFNFFQGIVSGDKSYGRTRTELARNADFCDIMDILRDRFQPSADAGPKSKGTFTAGHPKMVKLEQVVVDHFNKFQKEGGATRVMIFSQYRDSVQEITQMLQQHAPLVKVMSFIGQSSAGKATKGFTQKEQLQVMQAFRTGGYNTLVSTCVGEEGLDIGDVDLIVCFDALKSPIRLVQRMGRTGRKRQGRIVMLVTEGKEEQIYNHSQYTKRSIHRAIVNGAKSLVFYTSNPRMIPTMVTPACHRMHITVKQPINKGKALGKGKKSLVKLPTLFSRAESGKARNSSRDDAGISIEEFVELRSTGTVVTAKCLPRATMVTLQAADGDDCQTGPEGEMCMAEWLPWQNSLQETSRFGHGRRTQHLVDLLELSDVQQMLQPDEDNYGQEMQIYLNMEDVIPDNKKPASEDITQFCIPADRHADSMQNREDSTREQPSKQGTKPSRAGGKKTDIEMEKDLDDSDILPEVNFAKPPAGASQKLKVNSNTENHQGCEKIPPTHGKKTRRQPAKSVGSSRTTFGLSLIDKDDFDEFEPDATCNMEVTGNTRESVIPGPSGDLASSPAHLLSDSAMKDGSLNPIVPAASGTVNSMHTGFRKDTGDCADDTAPMDLDECDKLASENEETMRDNITLNEIEHFDCVPFSPSLEGISILLDRIQKPDDLHGVDLGTLMKHFASSFSRVRHTVRLDSQIPGHQVNNAQVNQRQVNKAEVNRRRSAADLDLSNVLVANVEPEDPKLVNTVVDADMQLEHSFSDSLDEIDFDAVGLSLLQKKQVLKKQTTDSHSGEDSSKCSREFNQKNVEHRSLGPELSKVEPKSKKPVFKDSGDAGIAYMGGVDARDRLQNGMQKRQRSGFVYRLDESLNLGQFSQSREETVHRLSHHSTHTSSSDNLSMTPRAVHETCILKDDQSTSHIASPVSREKLAAASGDWMTGRDLLQTTPREPQDKRQETSVSDSFLHQHFLDDVDDDFDDAVTLPLIGNKKSSPQSVSTKSSRIPSVAAGQETVQTKKKTDDALSLHDAAHTPSLFSPQRETGESSPVSPRNLAPGMRPSYMNDSIFTFTQALACVHSHSHPEPSLTDSDDLVTEDKNQSSNRQRQILDEAVKNISHENCVYNPVNTAAPEIPTSKPPNVVDEEIKTDGGMDELEQSPYFDLDFDFDEDIIPPSPETETSLQSVSQIALRSVKVAVNAPVEEAVKNTKDPLHSIPEDHEFKDDDVFVAMAENNMEELSPCFASSFQTKTNASLNANRPITETVSAAKEMDGLDDADLLDNFTMDYFDIESEPLENPPSLDAAPPGPSQGFTCHQQTDDSFDWDESHSPILTQGHFAGVFDESMSHTINTTTARNNEQSDISPSKPAPVPSLQLPAVDQHSLHQKPHTSIPEEKCELSDNDLGHFAPRFVLLHDLDDLSDSEEKKTDPSQTPLHRKSPPNLYCSTPLSSKKPFRFSFQAKMAETPVAPKVPHLSRTALYKDDENDFEESIVRRKAKGTKLHSLDSERDKSHDDENDFEESIMVRRKAKGTKLLSSDSERDSSLGTHVRFRIPEKQEKRKQGDEENVQRKKKRKKRCAFLDDEAELSGDVDVSSDETDENLDILEGSFIDNATQASQTDMQAVYMKSVRSPVRHGRGFRLQYKPAHLDVFSQPPPPEEDESQYQEDSFCVGSDEDEDDEDDDHEESYETGGEDNDFDLTAMKIPRPPSSAKRKKKKQTLQQVNGRKRVRQIADSSSNEEDDFPCLPPSQITHAPNAAKRSAAIRALLSSSEENLDTSADKSSHGKQSVCVDISPQLTVHGEVSVAHKGDITCDRNGAVSSQGFQCSVQKTGTESTDVATRNSSWEETEERHLGSNTNLPFTSALRTSSHRTASVGDYRPQNHLDRFRESGSSKEKSAQGVAPTASTTTSTSDVTDSNTFTSIASKGRGKLVILVDSREISGAQDIVSALRLQHNALVYTRQLTACDYILSDRMAVDRLNWSGFSSSTNRNKLYERVQQMQALYDRCVIIVETDRVKPGEEKSTRLQQHSKYVDTIIAQLCQTCVRLFFTENQNETASLLAGLSSSEGRKSMTITAPVNLDHEKEQVVKFYVSIPMLNITHALNLCFNFVTVNSFLQSTVADIQTKGHMSFSRATEVHNYIHHYFSAALLPMS